MNISKLWKNSLIAALAVTLLSACGGVADRMNEVRDHWNATVQLENLAEAQYLKIQTQTNEGYMAIKNQYPLADQCFKNSGRVLQDAVAGRYDRGVGKEKPTGTVDQPAFVNALVVNEAYPGDIKECQALQSKIARDITTWRMGRANEFGQLWDMKVKLDGQYTGDLYRAMAVQLLQYAQSEAQKRGVDIPNYVYPTFNLEAVTRDSKICEYYQMKWNPALNQCTLTARAAYDYIFRPITAPEVQKSFDSGIDNLNPIGTDVPK